MIKTLTLVVLTFLEGLIISGQVVIKPILNITPKKLDKKIEVISNIPNPSLLGFLPSNVPNDRKYLKPSDEINAWVQNFVNYQFDLSTDPKAKKLLWIIQDLSLGKDSTQKDVYSFVKIKADIYDNSELSNENFQLVNTFDSTYIIKTISVDYGQMIGAAFSDLFYNSIKQKNTVANKRFSQMTEKPAGSKDDILNKIKLSANYPILKESIYTPGIYLSFNEFKNNSPGIKNFYASVDSQSHKAILYEIMPDSTSRLVENPWGASINNEVYFYISGQLYPIEKSGNTFYLAKYLDPSTRHNQAFYWRMYVGKWQGDNNPYNDAHVLKRLVADYKNIPLEATHLDFDMQDFIY